ncbi:MAG: DNA polymerase III subunit beta [Flavobacteriaceae bacterium]|nr:MAG: DNA polymerase III subunit beta [Flavobacteriaceae bacterium]
MQVVTEKVLKKITQLILDSIQPEKIILFGSYAWGKPHENSDVDLFVVVSSSDLPAYKRARAVYRSLRDIMIPFDVMVLTHQEVEQVRDVPSSLTYKVMREGKMLYG